MKYRTFPGTDLKLSEVGFGTWTLATGWVGEKTEPMSYKGTMERVPA